MGNEMGRWVLVSSAFPSCSPDQRVSLGHHTMRGVETPQETFTLIDDND
jgi:class 3 adenylate cyclase